MKKIVQPNNIYHGYAQEIIPLIDEESVALSFWSPPYFVGKNYEKEYTFDSWQLMLKEVIQAHFNVIKKGGFLVINIDDILAFADENMPRIQAVNKAKLRVSITKEQILELKAKNPDITKYELAKLLGCSEQTIDRRLNGNNIRGGKHNTQTKVKLTGHYLEQYAAEAGFYLYDRRIWVKDPTWANSQWHSNSYRAVSEFEYIYVFWKPGETVIDRDKLSSSDWANWASRGVWNIRSVRSNKEHEAQFPIELAERVIKLYTHEQDVVLDPFIGSGTTAVAAQNLNRRFIGIEKEQQYFELAKRNLSLDQMVLAL
ncbi:DNA methyltransferase [Acinetobacter variabilis]|uniref:DNA methyltransferase n=1 Tax=Acinetobacter variabilis TaxID=70346 RepID=UPI0030FC709E